MIDYDKPDDDPIVAEVRRAREEIAAQFDYDVRAVFEHYQRKQASSPADYASPRDTDYSSGRTKKVG